MRVFRKTDLEVDRGKEKENTDRKRKMAEGKLKIERGSGKGTPGVPELLFCGS